MAPDTVRSLADVVFVRTRKELARAAADPRAAQERRLRAILDAAADTEVGRRYGFRDLAGLDEYRARVPLSTWDDVEPYVNRMLAGERGLIVAEDPYFYATTSGTTGRRKLIPVTSSFVEECRVTNKVLYRTTLQSLPQLLKGKRLSMRSPKTERLNERAVAGSITVALGGFGEEDGLLDAVPADVFFVDDFEAKYFLALRFALEQNVTVCSAVNPSTLLLFARALAERGDELALALENGVVGVDLKGIVDDARRERLESRASTDEEAAARIRKSTEAHKRARMRDVFPQLAGLVCWKGGSAPWYLDKLKESYGDVPVLDYGYCASEGMFGAPLSTEGAASVLLPHGHVVELLPVDATPAPSQPRTVLLDEAELGKRYFVVVTTGAGLYRYQMNDVVEIVGRFDNAPLAVFLHKGGAMASVTGEKLSESHVVNAMATATRGTGVSPQGFVAAPVLPEGEASPYYLLAVDGDDVDEAGLLALARAFDEALRRENEEYDAKRKSLRLDAVVAARLPAAAIARFRERRVQGGAPDAHVKVPHVSADGALLLELGLDETAPALAARLPCRARPAAPAAVTDAVTGTTTDAPGAAP